MENKLTTKDKKTIIEDFQQYKDNLDEGYNWYAGFCLDDIISKIKDIKAYAKIQQEMKDTITQLQELQLAEGEKIDQSYLTDFTRDINFITKGVSNE